MKPADGGEIHRISFLDPASHLRVIAEVRTFKDFPALDWVFYFNNEATTDSPILETIEPLDWTMASTSHDPYCLSWAGGNGGGDDFNTDKIFFEPKKPRTFTSAFGLSSRIRFPYFTLCDGNWNGTEIADGPGGISVAIGWTGNWSVSLTHDPDAKITRVVAGMQKTHLLLHPGESIRTPRIVVLNWKTSMVDTQNLWRQFALKYYSQSDTLKLSSGGHLPVALVTPGGEPMDARLNRIKQIHDAKIPIDLCWVDSGW